MLVAQSHALLRRPAFWLVLTVILTLHLLGFGIAFARVHEWRILWTVYLAVPEFAVFTFVLNLLLPEIPKTERADRSDVEG